MNFVIYLVRQIAESLKFYRGFILTVYIVAGVVALYCLFV